MAAFSPRRAYSTIGLVAFFLIVEGVTAFIYEAGVRAGWSWADMTSLLAPITTLEGAYQWFFGGPLLDPFPSAMTSADYLAAALATPAGYATVLLACLTLFAALWLLDADEALVPSHVPSSAAVPSRRWLRFLPWAR